MLLRLEDFGEATSSLMLHCFDLFKFLSFSLCIIALPTHIFIFITQEVPKLLPDGPPPQAWLQGGVSSRGLFDSDSIDTGFFDVLKALIMVRCWNTYYKVWECCHPLTCKFFTFLMEKKHVYLYKTESTWLSLYHCIHQQWSCRLAIRVLGELTIRVG